MTWLLSAAFVVPLGCASLIGIDDPTESADASSPPPSDAALVGEAGHEDHDASLDATAAAAEAGDSSPDSFDSADTGHAPTWCTAQGLHTSCSDFDDGSLTLNSEPSGPPWMQVATSSAQGAATVLLDSSLSAPDPASGPGALQANLALMSADQGDSVAALVASFSSDAASLHVEFDLRLEVDAPLTNGTVSLFSVSETCADESSASASLRIDNSSVVPAELAIGSTSPGGGEQSPSTYPVAAPLAQTWTHVSLTVTRVGTQNTFVLAYGGTMYQQAPDSTLTDAPSTVNVTLGLQTIGMSGSSAVTAEYDNVIVDVTE